MYEENQKINYYSSSCGFNKTYNDWGGLVASTLPLPATQYNDANIKAKNTTTYSYDNTNYPYFLTKKQWYQNDTKLLTETYNYNNQGRISRYTNAKNEVMSYNYTFDTTGNRTEEVITKQLENGKSAMTKLVYSSETGYAYPKEEIRYYTNTQGIFAPTKISRTYNLLLGLVATETDNENNVTTYSYDNLGRITKIQYPSNNSNFKETQEYMYTRGYNTNYVEGNYIGIYGTTVDARTCYIDLRDGSSEYYNQTNCIYDAYGNIRQESKWDGTRYVIKSKYSYDKLLRVISYTDAENNIIVQSYNPWGEVNEITDPSGNLYVNYYDIKNNKYINYFVSSENIRAYRSNPSSNSSKENYIEIILDHFGRAIQKKVYESWPALIIELSESYQYDIAGNLIGYIDPKKNLNENGITTGYLYDELNRLIQVKDALNQITEISYTLLGDI